MGLRNRQRAYRQAVITGGYGPHTQEHDMGRHTYYPPIPKPYRRRSKLRGWLVDLTAAALIAAPLIYGTMEWLQ